MPSRARLLSSRLAAKAGIQQIDAIVHADRAAAAVDRALAGLWRQLLAVLRDDRGFAENRRRVLAILAQLQPLMRQTIGQRLERLARWGHRATAKTLAQTLPVAYLRKAAPVPVEVVEHVVHEVLAGSALGRRDQQGSQRLDLRDPSGGGNALARAHRLAELTEADEPAEPAPSDAELRRLFAELIFPPPSLDTVQRIVFAGGAGGRTWQERIAGLSRLAPPETLASIVANSMSQGLSQREIAKELLPAVNNVRASARRVARTEGLRVASSIQDQAHEQLGDLVVGYTIRATLDQNTRPAHRLRNGATWMKASGQSKQEALHLENGAEFPPDSPNCRCFLTPVLAPPPEVTDSPEKMAVFRQGAGKVVPDPATWDEWFQGADDRRRRLAVGTRRLAAAEDLVGKEQLTYAHLVNPQTGELLTIKQLQAESPDERARRVAAAQTIFAKRKNLIQQASTFGFLPTNP